MADEHFFYISPNNISKNCFTLDAEEAHHALNVLRLQVDDEIWLLDGVGTAYRGIIREKAELCPEKYWKQYRALLKQTQQCILQ